MCALFYVKIEVLNIIMQITPINIKTSNSFDKKSKTFYNPSFGSIVKSNIGKILLDGGEEIKDSFLCIVSGPSGVGKDTILGEFAEKFDYFSRVTSCTTRSPRVGEVNGKHYHFLTSDVFQEGVKNDEFLEYVNVYGDMYYGTRRQDVDKVLNNGKRALLQLDVEGAMRVRKLYPEALTVFIKPPSVEDLYARLINRGSETMESIKERVARACYELQYKDDYDVVLQNDVLSESVEELAQIFRLKK